MPAAAPALLCSSAALRELCARRRYTCWMDGKLPSGFCYLMSQEGYILEQGCNQPVRFVCREKRRELVIIHASSMIHTDS